MFQDGPCRPWWARPAQTAAPGLRSCPCCGLRAHTEPTRQGTEARAVLGCADSRTPGRSSGSWSFQTQAPKGRLDSNVAPDHGGPRGGHAGQQTRAQGPAHPRAQCRGVLVLLDREQRECGVMADFKHQRQGGLNSQCSLLSWEAGHLIYGRSGVWLGPGAWSLEGCLLTVSSYGPRDKRALWALTQGHRSHSRRLHPPDSGTSQWPLPVRLQDLLWGTRVLSLL